MLASPSISHHADWYPSRPNPFIPSPSYCRITFMKKNGSCIPNLAAGVVLEYWVSQLVLFGWKVESWSTANLWSKWEYYMWYPHRAIALTNNVKESLFLNLLFLFHLVIRELFKTISTFKYWFNYHFIILFYTLIQGIIVLKHV